MNILSQSSQQVILSPAPNAMVFTAAAAGAAGGSAFLGCSAFLDSMVFFAAAGPGLGFLGPGFCFAVLFGGVEVGDDSLDSLSTLSESSLDLLGFRTLASSTELEDSLDLRALDLADAGNSLLRTFLASSNAESSPKKIAKKCQIQSVKMMVLISDFSG